MWSFPEAVHSVAAGFPQNKSSKSETIHKREQTKRKPQCLLSFISELTYHPSLLTYSFGHTHELGTIWQELHKCVSPRMHDHLGPPWRLTTIVYPRLLNVGSLGILSHTWHFPPHPLWRQLPQLPISQQFQDYISCLSHSPELHVHTTCPDSLTHLFPRHCKLHMSTFFIPKLVALLGITLQ
jgi:hypothetical protein